MLGRDSLLGGKSSLYRKIQKEVTVRFGDNFDTVAEDIQLHDIKVMQVAEDDDHGHKIYVAGRFIGKNGNGFQAIPEKLCILITDNELSTVNKACDIYEFVKTYSTYAIAEQQQKIALIEEYQPKFAVERGSGEDAALIANTVSWWLIFGLIFTLIKQVYGYYVPSAECNITESGCYIWSEKTKTTTYAQRLQWFHK